MVTRTQRAAWIAAVVALSAIACATLRPMAGGPAELPIFCIACGELGVLDAVLNVALFMPLGAALVAAGWSVRRAALACFLLSLAVETLQFRVVTGRDTSLSDLTTNTVGGWLGASLVMHWRVWIWPSPRVASRIALSCAVAALAVLALTVAALRPTVPEGPYFGQYAPLRLTRVRFDGVVHAFTVGGVAIPYSIVDSSEALRDSLERGSVWARADITTQSIPGERSDIVRVGTRSASITALSQREHDMLYRTRLRAADWRVRVPTVLMRGAFPRQSQRYRIEGSLGDAGWHLQSRWRDGYREFDVPFSSLLAWSFFLPFEFPLDERREWLNALWVAALMFPAGYYSAWAVRSGRGGRRRSARVASWALVPAALLAALTIVIPRVSGFTPPTLLEIFGATAGLGAGIALAAMAQWLERARSDFPVAAPPNEFRTPRAPSAPRRAAEQGM